MNLVFWAAVVLVILATYFSALSLSLLTVTTAAVERRLMLRGRPEAGHWLREHDRDANFAVTLIRTIARLGFFALVLVQVAGFGPDGTLTFQNMFIAGGIAVAVLWLLTTIVASALARYAAVGLITSAVPLLVGVTYLCLPLIRALGWVDEVVRRLIGASPEFNEAEAEFLRSIEETQRQGALDEKAVALLENVVEFGSTDVGEVMTPRTDINGIELTDDLNFIRDKIAEYGHSRIPVYVGSLDNIVGILYAKDLLPFLGREANGFKLQPLLRRPTMVPETKPVRELLSDFQRSEVHMAIVIDEYGGTAGLVTIEDVLEELVGEIHDEHDPINEDEPTLIEIDETHAEVDGRFHIDDLNERLHLALPEDEEFDTVAGFVLDHLGRVPEIGEAFETGDARFTVLDATPTHIQRIGIELLQPVGTNGVAAAREEQNVAGK